VRLSKHNLNQEKKKTSLKSFLWAKTIGEFIQKQLKKVALPDYLSFTIYAIIIGVFAGLTTVLFNK